MIREYKDKDYKFLREMLFEAVYWRSQVKPDIETALLNKGVKEAIDNFGQRQGDKCFVESGLELEGAAWYRFYDEKNQIRGYINNEIPVVVIGVSEKHRRKGVGYKLLKALLIQGKEDGYEALSLCVSKDNYALKLYERLGFIIYEDIEDSLIMIYKYEETI